MNQAPSKTPSSKKPAITIGMLVYNEQKYLAETLRSIQAQDFTDYELIVLDNASTDESPRILQQFAQQDPRIRWLRQEVNRGAMQSWEQLIDLATAPYFALAAGHDLWSANYLSSLKQTLDDDPMGVLAYAPAKWIDQQGAALPYTSGYVDTAGNHEVNRFLMVLWTDHNCMYGLYRTNTLRQTSYRAPHSIATESVILQELAARGNFRVAPEATWYYRRVRDAETVEQRLERYFRAGFLFPRARSPLLPFWRIPAGVLGAALRAPVPWGSRLAMFACGLTSLIFLRAELLDDLRRLPTRLARRLQTVLARKRL